MRKTTPRKSIPCTCMFLSFPSLHAHCAVFLCSLVFLNSGPGVAVVQSNTVPVPRIRDAHRTRIRDFLIVSVTVFFEFSFVSYLSVVFFLELSGPYAHATNDSANSGDVSEDEHLSHDSVFSFNLGLDY